MTAERVKEALRREEAYLIEIQKAAERQLAVLKAERVVLERQILHHEDGGSKTQTYSYKCPVNISSLSQSDLPELKLDVVNKISDGDSTFEDDDDEDND